VKRLINRRQQGDLGEASAIEWLTSRGALVLIPFGHSPDFDLVAQIDDRLVRIQVKTTTQEVRTANGDRRFPVSLVTCGGNQSWTGVSKKIDPRTIDYLFVLTGSGRRWFIPATALEGATTIQLGGPRYGQCEIEPGRTIRENVYGETAPLELPEPGEYPRGQRMAAVNRPAQSFAGSTPASPIGTARPIKPTNYERKPGQRGEAVINQKRRITIPQGPFFEAGFANGGRVRVRADGPGRIVIEQIELPEWAREPAGAERRAPD
jgi:PD-(D/E)XK endonuclease